MITEDFMNVPRVGLTINVTRLDYVVWDEDEVRLYMAGRPEPLRVGLSAFRAALDVWHLTQGPAEPRLHVLPAPAEEAEG